MPIITASRIFSPQGWLSNHLLQFDEDGTIQALRPILETDNPQFLEGILFPGLINAHCHLELSMLKGKIPAGTGMVDFIRQVISQRHQFSAEEQVLAATDALIQLKKGGTVGLGDICNMPLTAAIKERHSAVLCQNFIELLGLDGRHAESIFQAGQALMQAFKGLRANITPHAPYSVSTPLLKQIYQEPAAIRSIHLMESLAEIALFESTSGPFPAFYQQMGIPYQQLEAIHPLDHICQHLPKDQAVIWVHGTELNAQQINQLLTDFPHSWFCLCPRSNQYIHQKLPDIQAFLPHADRICLGTDSLASNHSLDVWEEVRLLAEHYPNIPLHTLLTWASSQGALALQLDDQLGQFKPGTRPGINFLPGKTEADYLSPNQQIEVLS